MHPMVKFLINSICDKRPIDWEEVDKELNRITISPHEKQLCQSLKTIYHVTGQHRLNNSPSPLWEEIERRMNPKIKLQGGDDY